MTLPVHFEGKARIKRCWLYTLGQKCKKEINENKYIKVRSIIIIIVVKDAKRNY